MTPEDLRKAADILDTTDFGMGYATGLRAMADAKPTAYWAEGHYFETEEEGLAWLESEANQLTDELTPLYTTPQRPQWAGLTELEIAEGVTENRCGLTSGQFSDVAFMKGARFAEKAMRAKNGGAA